MQVSVGGFLASHNIVGHHNQDNSSHRKNSTSSIISMKERRGGGAASGVVGGSGGGESLFSFRRSNNRYSLHLDKPNKKESDVTLKRASWSSFPLLRFSSPEEKNNCKDRLQNKSQSNEEIKNNLNGIPRGIATPVVSHKIGCNFLRGSTASIRSAFSSNSSSPPSTTSSCSSSSTSSSPNTRSATSTGNSSITSILEGSGCDSQYGSCSTLEDSLPYLPAAASISGHTTTGSLTSRSTSDTLGVLHHNHNPLAYLTSSSFRVPSSVSSFQEEEEEKEEEIKDKPTTAPKILYAHKKTPDLKRKTRKQLVKDIEFIKTHGVVPEHIEDLTINKPKILKSDEEKENLIPLANNANNKKVQQKPKSNFKFMQNYRFLSKMDTKKKSVTPPDSDSGTYDSGTHSPSRELCPSVNSDTTADLSDESHRSSRASSVSGDKNRLSPVSCDSQSLSDLEIHNDILTALRNDHNGALNGGQTDAHTRLGLSEPIIGDFSSLFDRQLNKFKVFGEIIEEEEDSECDLSEFMVHAEESNRFERSIEHSLEMLGERDSLERDSMERDSVERDFGADLESNPSEHGEAERSKEEKPTNSQNESNGTFVSKVQLKLDLSSINKTSPPSKEFRRYLLRHISEEHINTIDEQVELRSNASSPSTPRSPAIDIDDVFKQKQKEISDGSKDDMLRVREVAQKLKLSTRRPSYVDWLGSIKTKKKLGKEDVESKRPKSSEHDDVEEELTDEKRKENLNSAMCWLRKELNEMRVQDQQLARQLMQLRLELQRLRLVRSCSHHQALVEEVTNEAEEQKFFETSDVYDVYEELPDLRDTFSPVLREIGVTRMNITSRRFSLR